MYETAGEARDAARATRDTNTQAVQAAHGARTRKAQDEHAERIRKAQDEHNNRMAGGMSMADSNRQFQQDSINSAAIMQQERVKSTAIMQQDTNNVQTLFRSDMDHIGQAEQMGWTRPNRQLAFATIGQMGGKGFNSPEEIQKAAHSIAGGNQIMEDSLMGNMDHDLKGGGINLPN